MRNEDPRGRFEMPGLRGMMRPGENGSKYFAPWFADADAIRSVWTSQQQPQNSLRAGDVLGSGVGLVSQNGQYTLRMETGGNLVQRRTRDGSQDVVWQTNTTGNGNSCAMQWDGNLCVYTTAHKAVFESGTAGQAGAYLLLKNDGDLVLYHNNSVVWKAVN